MVTGLTLVGWAQQILPDLTPESILNLDIPPMASQDEELAVICTLATGLKYIWETRAAKKTIETYKMRAEVEAKIIILRKSRYLEVGRVMETMLI